MERGKDGRGVIEMVDKETIERVFTKQALFDRMKRGTPAAFRALVFSQ